MNDEQSIKRRAVYTGLKPFLDTAPLMEAIDHWEHHYANSPRFTLQRFVADICRDHNLRERRSDILLSLVQSMNMSSSSLLPDPHADRPDNGNPETARMADAFCVLMSTLLECIPADKRHTIRLDLYGSIDQRRLPPTVSAAMQAWLGNDRPLVLPSAPAPVLRALVNRVYVVMCERLGPVDADRVLALATNSSQSARPDLGDPMSLLL